MKITTNQLGQYLPTLSRSIGDALHLHAVPSRTTMAMVIAKLSPGGPIPHNLAKTFDGPPTLERSGSEHRVGRLHPRFLRKRGLGRKWSSLWLKGDGGIRKMPFFMGKSDANERNDNSLSNCRVQPALSNKEGRDDFRKTILQWGTKYNIFQNTDRCNYL